MRSPGQGKPVTRIVWLVEVRVLGVDWEPWLLLTDWPVTDAQCAVRILIMYRQRDLCGLSRLLEMLATKAILSSYATQHQGLPPNITALLHGWQPPGDV